jgi:hypothetical protein
VRLALDLPLLGGVYGRSTSVITSSTQPWAWRLWAAAAFTSAQMVITPAMLPALGCAPLMPPRPEVTKRGSLFVGMHFPPQFHFLDFPNRIEHRDGRAVHNALRADVHVRPCGHLAVLRHSKGVEALPVVRLGVVGDHHAVGHHHAGCIGMRGEEAHRMAAIHDQGLVVGHLAQVAHGEQILRPVLKHRPVAAIGDKLVRMLRHGGVQVVLHHKHDGRGLLALGRIVVNGPRVHGIRWRKRCI